jgi:frataxin-like iron-binding protein CyaY
MSAADPQRNPEELARVAEDVFSKKVRPTLRPEDEGKYVAIDLDTGNYEVDADDYTAVIRLRKRCPEAEIWLERAGQPTAYQLRLGR